MRQKPRHHAWSLAGVCLDVLVSERLPVGVEVAARLAVLELVVPSVNVSCIVLTVIVISHHHVVHCAIVLVRVRVPRARHVWV